MITFLAPSTRVEVLKRFCAHVATAGRAAIGFDAGRDCQYDQFLSDAATAGLKLDLLLSAWDLRPFTHDADFLVAHLRPARELAQDS